jgi:PAS domain S-box-containing protein
MTRMTTEGGHAGFRSLWLRTLDAKRYPLVFGGSLVGGYFAALLGYLLTLRPAGVVFLWPPSGLVLGALVLLDRRLWPVVLAGSTLGNAAADFQHGASNGLALAGAVVNALEQVLAATVVLRVSGRDMRFATLRDVGALVLGAAVLSNALTAVLGSLVLRGYTHALFWRAWFNWWAGDGMGMLVLAPVVLTLTHAVRSRRRPSLSMVLEGALVLGAIVAIASLLLVGSGTAPRGLTSFAYLVFPLLIWAGIRFGAAGAAAGTLALTGVVAWYAVRGALPLSGGQAQVLEIYIYLSLASLSSLVPAAILSERAAATRSLLESEGRFREIADFIDEAFFVADVNERKTLYVNKGWSTIWGRPLQDGYDPLIWFEAIHPDDRALMAASMQTNAQGEATTNVFRILRPDGEVRWLRGRAFPVRDAEGVVRRVAGVTADITELREAEERFIQAQKLDAVGRLASGVAHDFNNLLTVIFGEADVVSDEVALPPQSRESITAIRRAAERAAGLTRQLLAFSRKQIIEPRVFDLNVAVSDTSKMLQRLIGEDIGLDIRLAREALGVLADRGQIEQVLTNLAVNARDAMPDGGSLTITTEAASDDVPRVESAANSQLPTLGWVAFTVADTGVGMTPDVLSHAFEPFFSTKGRAQGTGLGLATCYGIATQAGGRISISSTPGKGTAVRVLLPRVEVSSATTEPSSLPMQPRGSERILLVEDDTAVRTVTARLLAAQGYQVTQAKDATAALHELHRAQHSLHLMITDVVLPGISGRELADIVSKNWPETRILFVTGYTDDVVLKGKLISDELALLQKPFTSDALGRRVREVLDRKT